MSLHDWNVVVSTRERQYREARRALRMLGPVSRTQYGNLLVMRIDDIPAFLEALRADPASVLPLGHVGPCTETFNFASPEDFSERSRDSALRFSDRLAEKRFHVRMHRRGFKGQLHAMDEERRLDNVLLDALQQCGKQGHIDFHDPDAIVTVESIDNRAGLACWTREDLLRYPFLQVLRQPETVRRGSSSELRSETASHQHEA
jgi:hypothetical protein